MKAIAAEVDDAQLLETASELRMFVAVLRRRLAEQSSPGDFTPSQVAVMTRLLNEGPATLTALANAEGMRPQSMSAIVAALQAVGAVEKRPDPTDGRATILVLADSVRERVEHARVVKNDWLFRAMRAKYTPAEQAQLVDSLRLLQRLTEHEKEKNQ
jgi:DNA-binding MarR family transcriptional regulator